MKYAVVIERADGNDSAYVPDLPGCVSVGAIVEETARNIQEAIELHLEGMREDGDPIPNTRRGVMEVEVAGSAA